jgi:hypothetical protein
MIAATIISGHGVPVPGTLSAASRTAHATHHGSLDIGKPRPCRDGEDAGSASILGRQAVRLDRIPL